jgi:hypothetical protein
MNDFETMLLMLFVYAQGITVGYIICDLRAPKTPFKKGFANERTNP